jgi:hypothetical protein
MSKQFKDRHQLAAENKLLRMALEDALSIIERPGDFHHRFVYDPTAAPRGRKVPGMKGAKAVFERAKEVLAMTQAPISSRG